MTSLVAPMTTSTRSVSHVAEIDLDRLAAQAPAVEQLCALQADPTPFQTWEWLSGWCETFAADVVPRVVAVWAGDELVGLVPLMSRPRGWAGIVEWLGAGRSDHAPVLLRPGFEVDAIRATLEYLRRAERRVDLLSLRTLQQTQLATWTALGIDGLVHAEEDVSPRVEIDGDWDGYLARKSKKHRGNIRRLLRDQERTPALRIECVTTAPAALQSELREVEAASWKAVGGSLRMEGRGAMFYARFLARFAERGWLELWTCRVDARLLAYLITFRYRERVFYYNGGYRADAEKYTELPPGTLLIANALKAAHDRGLRSFDFLRGDEPYKTLWASERRPLYHVLVPMRWRGRMAGAAIQARWRLRRSAAARRAHTVISRIARRRAD